LSAQLDAGIRPPHFATDVWADLQNFADLKGGRHSSVGGLLDILLFPGTLAVLLFRLSGLCHRAGCRPVARLLYVLNVMLFGADLAPEALAGPGLVIPHPVGVVIAPGVSIGRNVRIFEGACVGGQSAEDSSRQGLPTLGDECWIFSGAVLQGPILVGERALVSAGAVVDRSVPADGIMAGNPARVVGYREGRRPPSVSGQS